MKVRLTQTVRNVTRVLEIREGPLLFGDEPGVEADEDRAGVVACEVRLNYRWVGGRWECFSAEGKGRLPDSRLGPNAFLSRLFFPDMLSSTPGWVLDLAAVHLPAPVV